jgi:hypothetical protein
MPELPPLIRSAPFESLLRALRDELAILEATVPSADTTKALRRVATQLTQALTESREQRAWLRCEAVAAAIDTSPCTVRREARLGRIPGARKIAGEWLIPVTYLDGRAA